MKTLKILSIPLLLTLFLFSCRKSENVPENEYAPDIVDQVFEVAENSPAGLIIGAVVASDRDKYSLLSYEIIDGNEGGTFEINPSSGILSVSDSGILDYEQVTQLVLTVSVSDGHELKPLESSAKITINITNVPEAIQLAFTFQPDGVSGKDALVCKIVPETNYGSLNDIHLYAWTQGGILNVNRALIDFDLSGIPPEAIIDSAKLSLYFNNSSSYGDQHLGETAFTIQRIISDWEESTVSWSSQPNTTTANQVNIDGAREPYQDFPGLDISSLIQDYTNDRENSYGLLLRLVNENPYAMLLLASSDNANEAHRPKLVVYCTIME